MRDNATMSRMKKLAHVIAKGKVKTAEEALTSVGYSSTVARKQASRVIKNPIVQNELARLGFTKENADRSIVKILDAPLIDQLITPSDKIAAAREVYKVTGAYAPEKRVNVNGTLADLLKMVNDKDAAK